MSDIKKHLGDERRISLNLEKIKEIISKSTVVVNWYAHTEDNTIRGPFCRWFKAVGEDKKLANIGRDVEYCALAMTILPNLVNEYEILQEQNKIMREALEFYAEIKNYDYMEQYNNTFTVIDPVDCEKFVDKWHDITFIGGKRAREALAKVGE